jgi:hypothetical protein
MPGRLFDLYLKAIQIFPTPAAIAPDLPPGALFHPPPNQMATANQTCA